MALDPALIRALETAVEDAGQPKAVAQRLQAWLTALGQGDASDDSSGQFYSNVLAELTVSDGNEG